MHTDIDSNFGGDFRFDVMFDLIVFAFKVLEHCSFFDNIVGKLIPLHISVPIDVDLIEEIGQISYEAGLAVG